MNPSRSSCRAPEVPLVGLSWCRSPETRPWSNFELATLRAALTSFFNKRFLVNFQVGLSIWPNLKQILGNIYFEDVWSPALVQNILEWRFPEMGGTSKYPKKFIHFRLGFSIINQLFWWSPIHGKPGILFKWNRVWSAAVDSPKLWAPQTSRGSHRYSGSVLTCGAPWSHGANKQIFLVPSMRDEIFHHYARL